MDHQHPSRTSHAAGQIALAVTRDLGDLSTRPPAARPSLGWHLRNWLRYRRRDLPKLAVTQLLGHLPGLLHAECVLRGAVYRLDPTRLAPEQIARIRALLDDHLPVHELPRHFGGLVVDYGVLSRRVVTNAGVNFLTDAFQGLVEPELLRYHGFGTGTTAEAAGDTGLVTEESTQYQTDNTRPTGSQTEGASANIYRTVGTYSPDSGGTRAITEHGIFSQAATGGGTLWDRSVFAAVNLAAGTDSLQVTHDTTFTSGG